MSIKIDPVKATELAAIINRRAERKAARTMPKVDAFKNLTRQQVRDSVNNATNLAQLKDAMEPVALAVWSYLNED